MDIGIDSISFYTSNYYLDLIELAKARKIDINKFHIVTNKQANYNIDDYVIIMERVDIYSTNDRILQLSDGSLKEINLNLGSL